MYILVGVIFFVVYYLLFKFLITKFNLKTVGREDDSEETKLYSKKDYQEKQTGSETDNAVDAGIIVQALGGAGNIETVDNCYTRLRLLVKDPEVVDERILKNDTGASGVIKKGHNIQVVYGLQVTAVRKAVDEKLGLHLDYEE